MRNYAPHVFYYKDDVQLERVAYKIKNKYINSAPLIHATACTVHHKGWQHKLAKKCTTTSLTCSIHAAACRVHRLGCQHRRIPACKQTNPLNVRRRLVKLLPVFLLYSCTQVESWSREERGCSNSLGYRCLA